MFGKRILILVPHPDDEVVACAIAAKQAQARGAEIFALYLTTGCVARNVMWPWARHRYESVIATRRAEAEAVAKEMSITPVGWSTRSARELWHFLPDVLAEVLAAITAHQIDQIWIPAYEGGNPDHDALNAVGSLLALNNNLLSTNTVTPADAGVPSEEQNNLSARDARLRGHDIERNDLRDNHISSDLKKLSVLEFVEYNYAGGKVQSHEFPKPNGREIILVLSEAEREGKRHLLNLYASEKRNLNYVDVHQECFRPLAAYDYTKPPHSGTLWYTRFQWVPFRHPGVDFTNPADVTAAINEFLHTEIPTQDHLTS